METPSPITLASPLGEGTLLFAAMTATETLAKGSGRPWKAILRRVHQKHTHTFVVEL